MRAGFLARLGCIVAAGLVLQACSTTRPAPAPAPGLPSGPSGPAPSGPGPGPGQPPRPAETPGAVTPLADLPGWAQEDHLAALLAYQAGCGAQRPVSEVCRRAKLLPPLDADAARRFLEETFRAQLLPGTGVLTAYFSPIYPARAEPDAEFSAPVRPVPSDLRPGGVYAARTAIDARPTGDALAWMRAEDLYFLQVQGSGTLVYPDGSQRRAAFAAHNGQPSVGIANPMRDRGLLPRNNTSGDAIRAWLADHRGPEAQNIMQINPRYVFFSLQPEDGRDPPGAAGISLPNGHAIAVDRSFHNMGEAFWIVGEAPILAGAFPSYRRLVVALDTGGAIRGEIRADLYLGRGDAAWREASRVRHDLRMYRLIPAEGAGR